MNARSWFGRWSRGWVLPVATACISAGAAGDVVAQPPASTSGVLITNRDLALIGGATIATAALSAIDVRVALTLGDTNFHLRHPGFTAAARRSSIVTETVLMATGGLVYGIARITGDRTTQDIAFHTTGSILYTAMFIQVVRGTLGRERPRAKDEATDSVRYDPYHFSLFRGFTSFDYRSFPSMHAMASMAAASALATEMRRRGTPNRGVIAPVLYTAAVAPALARMYLDEHWASDIAMGIFLGVFAGQKVVNYSHDHPDNRFDRAFLGSPVKAGFTYDARGFSFAIHPF